MSALTDWLEANKNVTPQDLEKFFSKYSPGTSPLDSALGSQQRPSPQAPADPAIPPTVIPKMEQMPVGRGSWFNRPPDSISLQMFQKKGIAQDESQVEEKARILSFIKANPELSNMDGTEMGTVKEYMNYLKIIKAAKNQDEKLNAKKQKDASDQALKARALKLKEGINPFRVQPSEAPAAGKGVVASPQDLAAANWAKANPNDPRAAGILMKLKQKGL